MIGGSGCGCGTVARAGVAPSSPSGGSSVVHSVGAGGAQRGERLVDVPAPVLELDDERDRPRPRREERARAAHPRRQRRRSTHGPSRRISAGTRNSTAPSRSPNSGSGSVSQATLSSGVAEQRPDRRAALGLHGEPEVGRRRADPAADRGRRRAAPEGRVELDGGQPRGVGREAVGGARARWVEARRPVGIGEAGRPDEEAAGHAAARDLVSRDLASRRPGRPRTASSARRPRRRRRRSPRGSTRRCPAGASAPRCGGASARRR